MPLLHSLYSPLFWLLLLSLGLAVSHAVRRGRGRPGLMPAAYRFLPLAGVLLAWLVSTPLGSGLLHRSLVAGVDSAANEEALILRSPQGEGGPQFILVAAMGYVTTGDPESDVLNDGTSSRVATAARWHARFPDATLVMQGYSGSGDIDPTHQGRLMKQFARSCGVPADKILLEPFSRNTREHVEEILSFEGIDPQTPIGVVSSDWHLRRVRMVFSRAFEQATFVGAPGRARAQGGAVALLPRERELLASSMYMREWLGIAWYSLILRK
jgi:uncharacterized SAM-binding protein YcdF (DUF218 family)